MRIDIDKRTFWDEFVYDWSSNKARRKRRVTIQKAKRASRRAAKKLLNKEWK